jgi:hypothetical protein
VVASRERDQTLYAREAGDERLVVALNFSPTDEQAVELSWPARTLVSRHLDREGPLAPGRVVLRPAEGLVLRASQPD